MHTYINNKSLMNVCSHMKVPVGIGGFNCKHLMGATHCSTILMGGTVSLDFKRLCKKSLIKFFFPVQCIQ